MQMKKCTKCEEHKSLLHFGNDSKSRDGKTYWCKSCSSAVSFARRRADPEKQKALDAAAYARGRERARLYYLANKEKFAQRQIAAYAADPEKFFKKNSAWRARNADLCSTYRATRRARLRGADGNHSAEDLKRLMELQKGRCACCRVDIKRARHVDHIIPLVAGGGNDRGNIQLLCPSCNLSKHARHPVEFMQSKGYLL